MQADEFRAHGHRLIEWIIDYHLPPVGSGTAPFEGGYMVNTWMRLKHPDYDQLRAICDWVGRTVRIRVS